jgi:hypothetical protein
MKRTIITRYILGFAVLSLLFSSCKKHEEFQNNPNQPSTATPALLLTNIIYSVFYQDNTSAAFATRHLTYYERGNSNVDYSWTSGSFGNYDVLRQVKQMDSLAIQAGQQQYLGLTKFFRVVLFSQLTETFGDIPYSDALEAVAGNFRPDYDSQESVYAGMLQELEEANALLDNGKGKINGDIIYEGDATQWKKLVNAYRLRLLIHLSKKESSSLNVAGQFQQIMSDPGKYPLFASNGDNAQLVFNASAPNNYYPTFGYLSLSTAVSMEKGFVKILKDRSDPRLFAIAEPVSGLPANVFSSYEGVDAGLTVSDQQSASADASRIKARYHTDRINEPWVFMSYAEQEFIIAEALVRGWITGPGTAEEHYNNGIIASMNFYDIAESAINNYLINPLVAFDASDALNQVSIQKHIAFFMNSGWEAFYEQRRTGVPTLSIGPGTYTTEVPKRWLYPQSEYDYNLGNLNNALQSQYGGSDDVSSAMWILQ